MAWDQKFIDPICRLLNGDQKDNRYQRNQPVRIWKYPERRHHDPSSCQKLYRDGLSDLELCSAAPNLFKEYVAVNEHEKRFPEWTRVRPFTFQDELPILVKPIQLVHPYGTEMHDNKFCQRNRKINRC